MWAAPNPATRISRVPPVTVAKGSERSFAQWQKAAAAQKAARKGKRGRTGRGGGQRRDSKGRFA